MDGWMVNKVDNLFPTVNIGFFYPWARLFSDCAWTWLDLNQRGKSENVIFEMILDDTDNVFGTYFTWVYIFYAVLYFF